MNKPKMQAKSHSRATGAIVASGSLLAIILLAVPWVDEYLRLQRDAAELSDLEVEYVEAQQRRIQLERIEAKLSGELKNSLARCVDPSQVEMVRESLIEMVRTAGARLRRLEISEGERRQWGVEKDHPRRDSMPLYGEPSRFIFHTHAVELQADGSLKAIRQILDAVDNQGWLMTTKSMAVVPTTTQESAVSLDLRLLLFGLTPDGPQAEEEEFAKLELSSKVR